MKPELIKELAEIGELTVLARIKELELGTRIAIGTMQGVRYVFNDLSIEELDTSLCSDYEEIDRRSDVILARSQRFAAKAKS